MSTKNINLATLLNISALFSKNKNLFSHFRSIIAKIDQTEFDGFEYVNPLLMSAEDKV